MTDRDADLTIRPGRIRDKGPGAKRAQSLVGQVMRAARQAGQLPDAKPVAGIDLGDLLEERQGRGRLAEAQQQVAGALEREEQEALLDLYLNALGIEV
jgi:hypothetical protein